MQAISRLNSRSVFLCWSSQRLLSSYGFNIRQYSHSGKFNIGCGCNFFNSARIGEKRRALLNPNRLLYFQSRAPLSLFSQSTPTVQHVADNASIDLKIPFPMEEIGRIPEPPPIPSSETLQELQKLIADNMREIGLASYMTPVGWVQNLLDILHSSTGLPWWQVIVISTIVVRACTLPVMIMSQRSVGRMAIHREEMTKYQNKLDEAQREGDTFKYQVAASELQEFMKEKALGGISKTITTTAINGVVFMSYFLALRALANNSLWSLREEGVLWFTNLTMADPTYILPIICAVSMLAMMELGVEFGAAAAMMKPTMRWVMRVVPITLIFFAKVMPTAVLIYWMTSNTISLGISVLFYMPRVRKLLKIPQLPKKAKQTWRENFALPEWMKEPTKIVQNIRQWRKNRKNLKKAPSAVDIRKNDLKRFKAAGEGPMPATFTFDPKTKYKEVFDRPGFFTKLKRAVRGEDKQTKIKKRAAG